MDFNEIKENIEDEFLSAFSIGYIPTKTIKKTVNGEEVRLLDDLRLIKDALDDAEYEKQL